MKNRCKVVATAMAATMAVSALPIGVFADESVEVNKTLKDTIEIAKIVERNIVNYDPEEEVDNPIKTKIIEKRELAQAAIDNPKSTQTDLEKAEKELVESIKAFYRETAKSNYEHLLTGIAGEPYEGLTEKERSILTKKADKIFKEYNSMLDSSDDIVKLDNSVVKFERECVDIETDIQGILAKRAYLKNFEVYLKRNLALLPGNNEKEKIENLKKVAGEDAIKFIEIAKKIKEGKALTIRDDYYMEAIGYKNSDDTGYSKDREIFSTELKNLESKLKEMKENTASEAKIAYFQNIYDEAKKIEDSKLGTKEQLEEFRIQMAEDMYYLDSNSLEEYKDKEVEEINRNYDSEEASEAIEKINNIFASSDDEITKVEKIKSIVEELETKKEEKSAFDNEKEHLKEKIENLKKDLEKVKELNVTGDGIKYPGAPETIKELETKIAEAENILLNATTKKELEDEVMSLYEVPEKSPKQQLLYDIEEFSFNRLYTRWYDQEDREILLGMALQKEEIINSNDVNFLKDLLSKYKTMRTILEDDDILYPEVEDSSNNGGGSSSGGSSSSGDTTSSSIKAERISGTDRVDTAVKLSKKEYKSADTVVIATKGNFADALTASTLASKKSAPILLVNKDSLNKSVKDEIKRLGAKNVIIVGGVNSVGSAVEKALKNDLKLGVERLAGNDRYETSKAIAEKIFSITGKRDKAIIANGRVFADALSVSPFAVEKNIPILLVTGDKMPSATKEALKGISEVYIAGGNNTVNKDLEKSMPKVAKRFAGKDRYATAVEIAKATYSNPKVGYVSSGQVFADALVVGPVAAKKKAPILLVEKNRPTNYTLDYLKSKSIKDLNIVGGTNSVSSTVEKDLKEVK